MTNPIDHSATCPTCGLFRHVHGCSDARCGTTGAFHGAPPPKRDAASGGAAELAEFLRSFASDQWPDDARQLCAAADIIEHNTDAPAMLELLREAMNWLEDPSAYAQDSAREFDERANALLDKHGRTP